MGRGSGDPINASVDAAYDATSVMEKITFTMGPLTENTFDVVLSNRRLVLNSSRFSLARAHLSVVLCTYPVHSVHAVTTRVRARLASVSCRAVRSDGG